MKRPWLDHEIEAVRQLYPNSKASDIAAALGRTVGSVYRLADKLGVRKSAQFYASPASGRLDGTTGQSGRFLAGQTSWNAGLKGWQAGGRSGETQFKKGRPAVEAHNYQPIGTERINRDGYLERKVTDDPSIVPVRRWVPVHRLVWEATHGPIPPGHAVAFLPGRRTTDAALITGDALELVSRAELARRNHPKNKSPELARLVQLKGAITRQVNRIAREAKEQRS
ncbi:hypothetical protein D9M68_540840 [compost metagenome]